MKGLTPREERVISQPAPHSWDKPRKAEPPNLHFFQAILWLPAQTRKHPLELEGDGFKNERRFCFIQYVMRC